MKNLIITTILIGACLTGHAQSDADVRNFSSQFPMGTARFNGLGGAMGALGGDMSSISMNPAGIAVFRFGEISFTPGYEFNNLNVSVDNMERGSTDSRVVINNVGFVLANELNNPNWKALNFGISYQRLNTFNDEFNLSSTIPVENSLMQSFANSATGLAPEELDGFTNLLAYEAFVINPDSFLVYEPAVTSGDIRQTQTSTRRGRVSETALSFGANYNDKVYVGLGIGFQSVFYELNVETSESPVSTADNDLVNYSFNEILEIEGLGVNLKLGAIVKAGKNLRFGAAIHTPTTFGLTDNFRNTISATFRDPAEVIDSRSDVGLFDYRIKTPWRFMGSVAGIIGKKAIVSAQYEFADFTTAELKNASDQIQPADFSDANQTLATAYQAMSTLRIGAEYRVNSNIYTRAGFAYFSNPVEANETLGLNLDLNRYQYSAGVGYREAAWSVDLSYSLMQFEEPYQPNFGSEIATLSSSLNNIALSIGIRL